MDNIIDFHLKKQIIDKLLECDLISGLEWYSCLEALIDEYKNKATNSV